MTLIQSFRLPPQLRLPYRFDYWLKCWECEIEPGEAGDLSIDSTAARARASQMVLLLARGKTALQAAAEGGHLS